MSLFTILECSMTYKLSLLTLLRDDLGIKKHNPVTLLANGQKICFGSVLNILIWVGKNFSLVYHAWLIPIS